MKKNNLTKNLEALYGEHGEWVQKNSIIFHFAKNHNLSVGGSIGMTVTCKKPKGEPGDLDFFTDSVPDAIAFISSVMEFLTTEPGTYYKLYANNETKFVMDGVKSYFKLKGIPFWKSICVMVLKKPVRFFYYHGLRVQYFEDIVKSAKEAEIKDGKVRTKVKFNLLDMDLTPFDDHIYSCKKSENCIS